MRAEVSQAYGATWGILTNESPLPARRLFWLVHRVHRCWRLWRRSKVYANPDNFLGLLAGHTLLDAQQNNFLIGFSARLILIAVRIQDCLKQLSAFKEACNELAYSWRCEYEEPLSVTWVENRKGHCFSPSTINWLKLKCKRLIARIKRFVLALFRLVKQAFLLSMRIMDAVEAFFYNEEVRRESVHELLVNGARLLDSLSKNRQELLRSLQNESKLIDSLLIRLGSSLTAADLTEAVSKALEQASRLQETKERAGERTGHFFHNWGKMLFYQGARTIGCHETIPDNWLPPANLDTKESDAKSDYQPFPPPLRGMSAPENPQTAEAPSTRVTRIAWSWSSLREASVNAV